MEVLLIGNDQTLDVTGVQNKVSGTYINNAVVTARVKHLNGDDVTGQAWPVTLAYVTSSDGNYRGVLEDGLELIAGKRYSIEIRIDAGSDVIGFFRRLAIARYRAE